MNHEKMYAPGLAVQIAVMRTFDLFFNDLDRLSGGKANREALLEFLGDIARENLSTILYVSHREDEFREFFTTHLQMNRPSV